MSLIFSIDINKKDCRVKIIRIYFTFLCTYLAKNTSNLMINTFYNIVTTNTYNYINMYRQLHKTNAICRFSFEKLATLHFCLRNKIFVIISSTTAYNELEVSNFQTAVDMCQCIYFTSCTHIDCAHTHYIFLKKLFFWCAQFGYLYFHSFQLLYEPGLGAGIDPGMALTPFPSSIGIEPTTFRS